MTNATHLSRRAKETVAKSAGLKGNRWINVERKICKWSHVKIESQMKTNIEKNASSSATDSL